MADTKDKILDSAQRLIGERGYATTSVRDIISNAGVNLAAIHYHFGSKEDLLDALIARKAGPVNEKRLMLLDRVEAAPGRPSLEKALEAWFVPMAEAADDDPSFVLLMGRLDGEGMMQTIVEKHFKKLVERITGAAQAGDAAFAGRRVPLADAFHARRHGLYHVRQERYHRTGRGHERFPRQDRSPHHVSGGRISGPGECHRQKRGASMKFRWILLLAVGTAAIAADEPVGRPLSLSLKRAVEMATSPEGNANIQLAAEASKQAQAPRCRRAGRLCCRIWRAP